MFVKKRKREEEGIEKSKRRKESDEFEITDAVLTSHLFKSTEPFINKLGREFQKSEKEKDEEESKKCVWKDKDLEDIIFDAKELERGKNWKFINNFMKKNHIKEMNGEDYEKCMREMHEKANPTPRWFQELNKNSENDTQASNFNQKLFLSNAPLINEDLRRSGVGQINQNIVGFQKMSNLNVFEMPKKGSHVLGIDFHISQNLSCVSSSDDVVRVYRVDGQSNPLLHKFWNFKHHFINRASFSNHDSKLVLVSTFSPNSTFFVCSLESGLKRQYYCCPHSLSLRNNDTCWSSYCSSKDGKFLAFCRSQIPSNIPGYKNKNKSKNDFEDDDDSIKDRTENALNEQKMKEFRENFVKTTTISSNSDQECGYISIICGKSYAFLHLFQTNSRVVSMNFTSQNFSNDEEILDCLVVGCADGSVYIYSIDKENSSYKLLNVVKIKENELTKIAVSDKYFAIGSNSGAIKIYERKDFFSKEKNYPKELKSLMNITTAIDNLYFSPDENLLIASSSSLPDKLRIFFSPNFACMKDFPNFKNEKNGGVTVNLSSFSKDNKFFCVGLKRRILLFKMVKN